MKFFPDFLVKSTCIALCAVFTAFVSAKPLSPVQVSIMPVQLPDQGQAVEFMVRATVSMDVDNLQLTVSVPQGINVLSGELHWQGPLLKGQEKLLHFTASLSNESGITGEDTLIQVQAAIVTTEQETAVQAHDHTRLAASAFYRWQTGAVTAAAVKAKPLNGRVVDRNGLKIHEYELRH